MKRVVLITVLLGYSIICSAQITVRRANKINLLKDDGEWYQGSILLSDESELKGLVKYNNRTEVLSYLDGDNSKPFVARDVLSFEFFDDSLQVQRNFYSIEQEDPSTGNLEPTIYEVIRDYKTFAVLVRTSRMSIRKTRNNAMTPATMLPDGTFTPGYSYPTDTYAIDAVQSETVCILDEKGKVRPYFESNTFEDGQKSWITGEDAKKKNKTIDVDLFAEYVSADVYKRIQEYAKTKDLKFTRKKEDFLKILEYYDSIREE